MFPKEYTIAAITYFFFPKENGIVQGKEFLMIANIFWLEYFSFLLIWGFVIAVWNNWWPCDQKLSVFKS